MLLPLFCFHFPEFVKSSLAMRQIFSLSLSLSLISCVSSIKRLPRSVVICGYAPLPPEKPWGGECCEAFQPLVKMLSFIVMSFQNTSSSDAAYSPVICQRGACPHRSGAVAAASTSLKRIGRAAARVARVVATPSAVTIAAPPAASVPAAADGLTRQTLEHTVAGQHAPIDGEVAAHHEGTHGGVLLGQHV